MKMDYNKTLDDLLGDLSQPKQDFAPKAPPTGPAPTGPRMAWPTAPDESEPLEARTIEEIQRDAMAAERTGLRIAKTVDGITSFAAALIAKEKETQKYKADPGSIDDLAKAWGAVSERYNFDVNPWFTLAFLNLTVYGPIFMKANNDRRFNQMQNEIEAMQQQIEDLRKEKENAKNSPE